MKLNNRIKKYYKNGPTKERYKVNALLNIELLYICIYIKVFIITKSTFLKKVRYLRKLVFHIHTGISNN